MAFWRTNRLQKQIGRIPSALMQGRLELPGRASIRQWTTVGAVAIVLGIAIISIIALPTQWAPLLIILMLCPFIAMIVGDVRRMLLAIIILDIPFSLDINLGYQEEIAKLGALVGWNISATLMCLLFLYAWWLCGFLTRRDAVPRPILRMSVPLASYLVCVVLSVVAARNLTLSLFQIFLLVQMFLLYVYIGSWVRTRQDLFFIVMMLLISLIFESLLMIGMQFIGQSVSFANMSARIDSDGRVGGTIGSPNNAANFVSVLMAPAASLLLLPLRLAYRWWAGLALGLGGIALILTLSRGGWLAFVVSITLLCIFAWRRGRLSLALPMVVAVILLLVGVIFRDALLSRLFADDAGSAHSRIPLMKLAFRMIQDHPLLGIGANNFANVMKQYVTPEFGGEWLYTVHNRYLLIWAETGMGGVAAFVWFLVATIRRGWQCWKLEDRFVSSLALGFTAGIAGAMAHMLVDVFNGRSFLQMMCLISGLITAMYSWKVKDSEDRKRRGATAK